MVASVTVCCSCVVKRQSLSLQPFVFCCPEPVHKACLVLHEAPTVSCSKSSKQHKCCVQLGDQGLQAVIKLMPLLTEATTSQTLQQAMLQSTLWLVKCAQDCRAVTANNLDDAPEVCLYDASELTVSAILHRSKILTA